MSMIAELIERLEKATGPDRELDCLILALSEDREVTRVDDKMVARSRKPPFDTCVLGSFYHGRFTTAWMQPLAPCFTGSVDAGIALCERVLPGWIWRVATCSVSDDAWVVPDFNCPVHGERLKREFPKIWAERDPLEFLGTDIDLRPSGRPAIALCIAILTAVERINELKA